MSYLQTILMWFSLVAVGVPLPFPSGAISIKCSPGGGEGDGAFFSRDRNVASPLYEIPQPEEDRVPPNAELVQNG